MSRPETPDPEAQGQDAWGPDAEAIASALHDQTGPRLFALTAALHQARMALSGLPDAQQAELAGALDAAEAQAAALGQAIRDALRDLEPPVARSLRDMLAALAAEFSQAGLPVMLKPGADPALSAPETLVFYRFVRESVLNALRHGPARSVGIRLFDEGGEIVARVIDDGGGPPPGGAVFGRGLRGISARARAIGATHVAPRRQAGRTVTELRMSTR